MSTSRSHLDQPDECSDSLNAVGKTATDAFRRIHGRESLFVVAAPGRVNVIGEHIDYNNGYVLPMAIDRYVVIAASPRGSQSSRSMSVHSVNLNEGFELQPYAQTETPVSHWGRYVQGVVAGFAQRGHFVEPLDMVIASNVPLGSGLSSSAAFEVATATLLETVSGHSLDPFEKAVLCQEAEHRYAGVPCGIMDQFASVFGQQDALLLLDCQSNEHEALPFLDPNVSLLIANTNVQHELSGSEYADRRNQCDSALVKLGRSSWRSSSIVELNEKRRLLTEVEFRRARHVVGEIARTKLASDAIKCSDWTLAGKLMTASHRSLRDDYEVSCLELDVLFESALKVGDEGGVYGTRMTGGGFGGCTVSLVHTNSIDQITEQIGTEYADVTGRTMEAFACRPGQGARVVRST